LGLVYTVFVSYKTPEILTLKELNPERVYTMNYLKIDNCPIYNKLNKRNKLFLYTYVFKAETQSEAYKVAYKIPVMNDNCYVSSCKLLTKDKIVKAYNELVTVYSNISEEEIIQKIRDIALNSKRDSDKLQALSLIGKSKGMFSDITTQTAIFNNIDSDQLLEGLKNKRIGRTATSDTVIDDKSMDI